MEAASAREAPPGDVALRRPPAVAAQLKVIPVKYWAFAGAVMRIAGRWNWSMPRRLDRLLPKFEH